MSSKKNSSTGCTNTVCTLCGVEGHSISGRTHRRCTGTPAQEGQTPKPRPKHELIAGNQRGKWR